MVRDVAATSRTERDNIVFPGLEVARPWSDQYKVGCQPKEAVYRALGIRDNEKTSAEVIGLWLNTHNRRAVGEGHMGNKPINVIEYSATSKSFIASVVDKDKGEVDDIPL